MMLLRSLSCLSLLSEVYASQKVRGVAPSKLEAYQNIDGRFTCLDGSKSIPYERVNDDYCDCRDGSDEPGTSACPGTSFFCQNAGHIPVYLPSNRVNDGACEEACCDGSDEWAGLTSCPNTCRQKAKEHAEIEAAKEATRASGWKVKEEWRKTAHKLRLEVEDELQRRRVQLDAFRINLRDKEAALTRMEQNSRSTKASDEAQKELNVIFLKYQGAISRLRSQVAEQHSRITQFETIMQDLAAGYNPNFQDMSVKGAVTSFNDLKALVEPGMPADTIEELLNTKFEIPQSAPVTMEKSSISAIWDICREKLEDIGLVQKITLQTGDTVETKQIVNARTSTEKLREEILQTERDVRNLESSLEENYGPNDVYRAVKGQCFSSLISDYTYEVCLLDTLHQKSPSTNTLVGNFDRVDENGSLHYSRGQRCWNGPERSGRVDVECGAKNELLSVREAQKCEYVFRVRSPLGCGAPDTSGTMRDEL